MGAQDASGQPTPRTWLPFWPRKNPSNLTVKPANLHLLSHFGP